MSDQLDIEELERFLLGYYHRSKLDSIAEQQSMHDKTKDHSTLTNIIINEQTSETISKYGDVIKEDIEMFKRLKFNHLQGSPMQKHGDAAEVMGVRDFNKEQILSGTGFRMELSESKIDPITDVVIKDSVGNVHERGQVKYYKTARETADSLSEARYSANDAKYVPKEQYDEVIRISKEKSKTLKIEALDAKKNGNIEEFSKKIQQSKNYEHTAENTRPFDKTYQDAKDASRNNISRHITASKSIISDMHSAGLDGAKSASKVAAVISSGKNVHAFIKGDKELGEAVVDTAIDTAKTAAMGYAMSSYGSIIKAGAQEVGKKLGSKALTSFANSARGPATFALATVEVGTSLRKYIAGDLGKEELFIELGEKGAGMVGAEVGKVVGKTAGIATGAIIGAIVGTFILPGLGSVAGASAGSVIGSVVGPFVGSMVGYMIGTQIYQAAGKLLSEFDGEKYRRLKVIYDEAYERMRAERLEMEQLIQQHYNQRRQKFIQNFESIERAAIENNSEKISNELFSIVESFSNTLQFKKFEDFDQFMLDSSSTLRL